MNLSIVKLIFSLSLLTTLASTKALYLSISVIISSPMGYWKLGERDAKYSNLSKYL